MKKSILITCLLVLTFSVYAKKVKVFFTYSQEDVHLMVDDKMMGTDFSSLKIEFEVVKELKFFKRGYYTKVVAISPENVITKVDVKLEKKSNDVKLNEKYLVDIKDITFNDIITNFPKNDVAIEVGKNFKSNNLFLGKEVSMFPVIKNELKNTKYTLIPTVVTSHQVKGFYTFPYFNMSSVTFSWVLMDNTGNVLFNKEFTTSVLTRYKNTKGLVASKEMKKITALAIKKSQDKLLTDPDFRKCFK